MRETRRIHGDFVLEANAYFESHRHEDDIAVYDYALDLHAAQATSSSQAEYYNLYYDRRTKPGEFFGIPMRCLLPQGIDNLAVAGRCVSCDRPMLGSVRVMPCAMAMGQAAGTAAALACKHGNRYRDVPTVDLQDTLRLHGAYLP